MDEQQDAGEQGLATAAQIAARSGTESLREYWTHGEGGIKIGWGTPGDFNRCVSRLNKYMTSEQAKGFCAERHHDALGIWPAEHKP